MWSDWEHNRWCLGGQSREGWKRALPAACLLHEWWWMRSYVRHAGGVFSCCSLHESYIGCCKHIHTQTRGHVTQCYAIDSMQRAQPHYNSLQTDIRPQTIAHSYMQAS